MGRLKIMFCVARWYADHWKRENGNGYFFRYLGDFAYGFRNSGDFNVLRPMPGNYRKKENDP
jgi:hypothetical protein